MKRRAAAIIVCMAVLLSATAAFAANAYLDDFPFKLTPSQDDTQQPSGDQSKNSDSNKRAERQTKTTDGKQAGSSEREQADSANQNITNQRGGNTAYAPAYQGDFEPRASAYSISYELNKGVTHTPLPLTCAEGQTLTLPNDITREGYTFEGWTFADNQTIPPSRKMTISSVNSNLAFAAQWKPVLYDITYNLNGGTVDEKQAPPAYTIESSLTIPEPTRAHYAFEGWDDGSGALTSQITINRGSVGNKTFTATWRGSDFTPTTQKRPTAAEVTEYLNANPFSTNFKDEIEEPAVLDSKGGKANPGKLSQATQDNALRATNFVRFLLGLDPFALDSREPSGSQSVTDANNYGDVQKAQASAVLLAQGLSNGHHTLKPKPANIDQALYNLAVRGTAECNLVPGENLAGKVIGSYMPDPGNLGTGLGHRSWITKPDKKWTGFGLASGPDGTWQTMGATGGAGGKGRNGTPSPTYVAWPNASIPIDCFPSANAESWWSILHPNGIHFDPANVVITLTDQNGNVITLDKNDNKYGGSPKIREYLRAEGGSLIFCPGKEYKAGDVVRVHVEGVVANKDNLACPLDYVVSFTEPVLNKMSYPTS